MTTARDPRLVSQHYDRDDLGETILAALAAAGKDPERLSPDDLAPVDQFHVGSKGTTLALIDRAGLARGIEVLDVGGGLGGPARTLATELDSQVTVLDLSESYCRVGEMLTERTGLADRVTFRHGDALEMPFPNESFDAAWTQHSSMNIRDKEQLYAEIRRVLRPAGRLAIHEIMAGPVQPIHFPVPWARNPEISFLRTASEVRDLVTSTGFNEVAWADISADGIAFWRERLAAAAAHSTPPPLGLHLLLGPDLPAMAELTLRNLEESRIEIIQGIFDRR